jgi:two-component system sensor histidine kinase YesM
MKIFSLQYKVLIFMLVLCIVPMVIVGIYAYINASRIVEQKASQADYNTVAQMGNGLEFILEDAQNISVFLIQNDDVRRLLGESPGEVNSLENMQILSRLQRSLTFLIRNKNYIHSINVIGNNGMAIQTISVLEQYENEVRSGVVAMNGRPSWRSQFLRIEMGPPVQVLTLYRAINDLNRNDKNLGIIAINLQESALSSLIRRDSPDGNFSAGVRGKGESKNNFSLLLDDHNRVISAADKSLIGKELESSLAVLLPVENGSYERRKIDGEDCLVAVYELRNKIGTLVSVMTLDDLVKDTRTIGDALVWLILAGVILCFIAAFIFSRMVLGRLKQLRVMMGYVENEEYEKVELLTGMDEISLLSASFKQMAEHLSQLFNQIYAARLKQRETELKALQAQINPHFLYNTLDTIYWLARMEKAPETASLILVLSKLFRLSLNRGNEITTVRREIEHLNNYMIIQQKRYGDKIRYSIEARDETLDYDTVKLVLQPLVENAIKHGVDKNSNGGDIHVALFIKDGDLCFTVHDNGPGIERSRIGSILSREDGNQKSVGISNVHGRIQLYSGQEYGLSFLETECGTTVLVRQPLRKSDGGEVHAVITGG